MKIKRKVSDSFLLKNATKFKFYANGPLGYVSIERRSMISGSWVISHCGDVWNMTADEFVHEPSPSNRDVKFIKDTRFDTVYEAYRVFEELLK